MASAAASLPKLFQPLRLRDLVLRNRIAMSPMCMYSCTEDAPGVPNAWHMQHYASRACGSPGLIIVEATGVSPAGRISPGDTGLWNEAQKAAFKPIVAAAKAQGVAMGIQLAHAGRKASTSAPWLGGAQLGLGEGEGGWETLAPSPIPFLPSERPPKEMSKVRGRWCCLV